MIEEITNTSCDPIADSSLDEPVAPPAKVKVVNLKLGLIYPELPTKFYAQNPLPRTNNPKPASVLA